MLAHPVSPLTLARWAAGKIVRRWLGISPRPALRSTSMEPTRPPLTVDTVWTATDAQAVPTASPMRTYELTSSAGALGWEDSDAENIRQIAMWLACSEHTAEMWWQADAGATQIAAYWLIRLRDQVYGGMWGLG
jgi:hypothetical protein